MARRRPDERSLVPIVDRLVDQRYAAAVQAVSQLRAEHPGASPDELADRLIRKCAKEMALGGAVTGGAAASPVAGMTVAAASAGADATYSVGRLGEMIMGLGLVYGHEHNTAQERAGWVVAVLGISEGAAVGLTGLAARAGSRGGARMLARLPSGTATAATAGRGRRAMARLSTGKGPWSLAALIPYGIGAGVGAAGNAVLAQSVGRAAKQYFANGPAPASVAGAGGPVLVEDVTDEDPEIVDAEVVDADVVETATRSHLRVVSDAEIVDAVVVERSVTEERRPRPE